MDETKWLPESIQQQKLVSISFVMNDRLLDQNMELSDKLYTDLLPDLQKEHYQEKVHPRPIGKGWLSLPEVFRPVRQRASVFTDRGEAKEQFRIAGLLDFNFSDGLSINSRDIAIHPYRVLVPEGLIPQVKTQERPRIAYPLIKDQYGYFRDAELFEVEEIMQHLLHNLAELVQKGELDFFLKPYSESQYAIQIKNIPIHPTQDFQWSVSIQGGDDLRGTAVLGPLRATAEMVFYEGSAVDRESRSWYLYPWGIDLAAVNWFVKGEAGTHFYYTSRGAVVEVQGQKPISELMRLLQSKSLPVSFSGGSHVVQASQIHSEIHLDNLGRFDVQQRFHLKDGSQMSLKGFSQGFLQLLDFLQGGLPQYLNLQPRELAYRAGPKRDGDLKLLKHIGITHYLLLELGSYLFEGHLTDGEKPKKEAVWPTLEDRIAQILTYGESLRDLSQICSRNVLAQFEDFVSQFFKLMDSHELIYGLRGQMTAKGLVRREFQWLYLLLKDHAGAQGGMGFLKSRSSLLDKMLVQEKAPLKTLSFVAAEKDEGGKRLRLPHSDKDQASVADNIMFFHALIAEGFSIYLNEQKLEELGEDDFRVEFTLKEGTVPGTNHDIDWFELNPKVFLRGEEVSKDHVTSTAADGLLEYQGVYYLVPRQQIPSFKRLEGFWLKLQKGKKQAGRPLFSENVLSLPRSQMLELLALRASGYPIHGGVAWKSICDFYDQLGQQDTQLVLPSSVKAELMPYQRQGVQWLLDLYRLQLGAMLADDMGLGKTLQALTFLEKLREEKKLKKCLIVVPSSLIYNWQSEVDKFTPQLPLKIFSSREKDSLDLKAQEDLVLVTTYGLLTEHQEFFREQEWNVLIFDEAQNLKGMTTKRTTAARSLKAQYKICLSGTPLENHFGEFFSLMDLLVPGCLGGVDEFRQRYVNPSQVQREEIDYLKIKTKPLVMRRTKREILQQLPDKIETKVSIAFEETQKQIYRDVAIAYNSRVQSSIQEQGEGKSQLQMLTALLRLRQVCSDPAGLPGVEYTMTPPKLETLLESLEEVIESGESALVFTQFLTTLERAEREMKAAGIPVYVIHGGTTSKQRQIILTDFNNHKGGCVLLMTLKTGGVGLNLTKASYVFHMEPWWNPAVENQATDRAHRMGQTRHVQVFRYIMHESLEEKMEILKNRKSQSFESLFSNVEGERDLNSVGAHLSKDDFDMLLKLD